VAELIIRLLLVGFGGGLLQLSELGAAVLRIVRSLWALSHVIQPLLIVAFESDYWAILVLHDLGEGLLGSVLFEEGRHLFLPLLLLIELGERLVMVEDVVLPHIP